MSVRVMREREMREREIEIEIEERERRERERERGERERERILKAIVPGVSMRPPLCTDAYDLLRCSATVGNLGERGEPDIFT